MNFISTVPLLSSVIDYYSFIQSSKFLVNSPKAFFKYLFRKASQSEINKFLEGELDEKELISLNERDLKQ